MVRCERVEAVLPDKASFDRAYAALPEWRRRKCDGFRFEADRRRSVAAWMLLRQMLAERGLDADTLPVSENEFGKPAFDPSLGIHFSLSHAGERVMAAVSDRPVGCDVEKIESFDETFVRRWVRKEAYLKAVGCGFGLETNPVPDLSGDLPAGWRSRDFDFGDGHLGCVVCG